MDVYIGLDVSLASMAICVLGEKGKIVTEAQVASAPDSLVAFMHELPHGIAVIGLEAGPLSQWLHKGLTDAGFETVLMEMARPRCLDMDLVQAQQARRALDYLVGYGLSPLMWRKAPGCRSAEDVLTVGINRAVALLADREMRDSRAKGPKRVLRELGPHPRDGAPVWLKTGHYGPFVAHRRAYASVPADIPADALTLERALALLDEVPGRRGRG